MLQDICTGVFMFPHLQGGHGFGVDPVVVTLAYCLQGAI